MSKRDQKAPFLGLSHLIFNQREGGCGRNGAAMSSHCALRVQVHQFGGCGEETAVLPARTTSARDEKWQAFNGSFWRWLLYYSGSANLTWPNEDLAPRHLLVSHFIMSSSPVLACPPGIMGVCLSERVATATRKHRLGSFLDRLSHPANVHFSTQCSCFFFLNLLH